MSSPEKSRRQMENDVKEDETTVAKELIPASAIGLWIVELAQPLVLIRCYCYNIKLLRLEKVGQRRSKRWGANMTEIVVAQVQHT